MRCTVPERGWSRCQATPGTIAPVEDSSHDGRALRSYTHPFQLALKRYKVTYCTDDVVLPGQSVARTTPVTGMASVPRKSGPLPTVAYVHGTSISFYDVPSNPNTFGDFNPSGESFEGPPSTAVFAGNGFIYIAPDYLGLGDSTVPRHRYFHAATEASSESTCSRRRRASWRT